MNIDFKQLLPDNIKMKVFVLAHEHVMYNMFINKLNMVCNGVIDKHMIKQYTFISTGFYKNDWFRGFERTSESMKIILLNDAFFRIKDLMAYEIAVFEKEENIPVIRFNTDQFYEEPKMVTEEIRLIALNLMEGDIIYDPRIIKKNSLQPRNGYSPKKVERIDRCHDYYNLFFTDGSFTRIHPTSHLLAVVEKGFDQEKRRIEEWTKKHTI